MYFQASDNSNRFTIETDLDGTTTNDLLGFRGAATDNILVLKGDGNVGIGTNTPSAKLDVRGNVSFFSSDASDYVSFTHSDNGIIINSAGSTSNKMFLRTGGSDALTIDACQNVGIGGSPEGNAKLDIKMSGVSQYLKLERSSSSGRSQIQFADENGGEVWRVGMTGGGGEDFVFWDGSANVLILDRSNNQAQFNNDVIAYYSSDKRLKENVKNIESPLEKLNKINGVEFDWIKKEGVHGNKGHDVGVIAQEIEEVLPEVVTTRDNGS